MLLHKKVLFISNIFLYFNSMCCTFSCASFTKHGACINYIQSGYTSNNLSFTYICTKSIIQKTDRLEYSMLLLLVIYFSLVRCKHWVQCESFTDMYKKQVTVIACLISLFVFSLLPFWYAVVAAIIHKSSQTSPCQFVVQKYCTEYI